MVANTIRSSVVLIQGWSQAGFKIVPNPHYSGIPGPKVVLLEKPRVFLEYGNNSNNDVFTTVIIIRLNFIVCNIMYS